MTLNDYTTQLLAEGWPIIWKVRRSVFDDIIRQLAFSERLVTWKGDGAPGVHFHGSIVVCKDDDYLDVAEGL